MDYLKSLLAGSSKKLLTLVAAAILVLFRDTFGLTPEQIQALTVLAGGYLVGQGVADVGKEAAKIKVEAEAKKK
jgi:hypothetical protein